MMLEIESANGVFMYDIQGKEYIDLISGVSVSYLGHNHPEIIQAIKNQADKHLHIMVYGEFIQSPQIQYAELLCTNLPGKMENVYFVNSGAEAIEGAMKLAKRFTGRSEIMAFKNAYHGSTQGALSIMGGEYYKANYRPLLPGIRFIDFNHHSDLDQITNNTACVVIDPIQSEAGVILPQESFLVKLQDKCKQTGTLLVFDEIQSGFGRLGSNFACQHFKIAPDILVLAKGLGGGMP
jgi:acetylornithine/N-succinyldiaminopimelate aminotransferase